jgi:hypothetical protein
MIDARIQRTLNEGSGMRRSLCSLLAAAALFAGGGYLPEFPTAAAAQSPAEARPGPAGQEQVIARMHAMLDRRLDEAAASRQRYWRELRAADGTVDWTRARRDLARLLRVPAECAGKQRVVEVERKIVARLNEGVIERVTVEVCRRQLLAVGLAGWPATECTPAPLVVAFHGTAGTPEKVFGIDDPARFDLKDYHHAYGRALMARGFAVFAPLLLTETSAQACTGYNGTRNEVNHRALPLGTALNGMQLGMIMDAVGFLLRDRRVRADRMGAYGISHGGQLAFYFAALDHRVRATVVSQWFESRAEKLAGSRHPDALWREPGAAHNQHPDILRYFTDVETAMLIAPRALLIEAGRRDGERAKSAEREFPRIASAYRNLGAPPGAACLEVADAGHEIVMKAAADFLEHWLRGDKRAACPAPAAGRS